MYILGVSFFLTVLAGAHNIHIAHCQTMSMVNQSAQRSKGLEEVVVLSAQSCERKILSSSC